MPEKDHMEQPSTIPPVLQTLPQRPKPAHRAAAPISKIAAVRAAIHRFLATELHGQEIRVTKISPINHGGAGWLAEAEIFVPNLDIKTLGLPLTQEILERERYLITLDGEMVVQSYEIADPNDE